jgi:hypothetical protein
MHIVTLFMRTSKHVAWAILRAVDVRRYRTAEVPDTDMERHPHAALILTRQIVSEPVQTRHSSARKLNKSAYQATTPGNPAYAPATHKNVPKYLAPDDALDMLIPNPTAQRVSAASMNGNRRRILSDQTENTSSTMAVTSYECRPTRHKPATH